MGRIVAEMYVGHMTYANLVRRAAEWIVTSNDLWNAGRAGRVFKTLPPVVGVFLQAGTRRLIPRAPSRSEGDSFKPNYTVNIFSFQTISLQFLNFSDWL